MATARTRSYRRTAIITGLIVAALALDAAAGFNFLAATGCISMVLMELIAMTAVPVLAVGGAAVWIFSGFKNQQALTLAGAALALGLATYLINHAAAYVGFVCLD
ncbi:MAG: hypothetical protein P8Y53_04590 [Pseudolabrys sp.]|jgi:hypothetical protein